MIDIDKMDEKSWLFPNEIILNGYIFYADKDFNSIYVPDTEEEFPEFLDALWKNMRDEYKGEEEYKNYQLFKKYPWLLVRSRWNGGVRIQEIELIPHTMTRQMKINWFNYHEGDMYEKINKDLFIVFQEEILALLDSHGPELKYKYRVSDTKEKYGTFRWYCNGPIGILQIVDRYMGQFGSLAGLQPW